MKDTSPVHPVKTNIVQNIVSSPVIKDNNVFIEFTNLFKLNGDEILYNGVNIIG
jgi:hypothetical protein